MLMENDPPRLSIAPTSNKLGEQDRRRQQSHFGEDEQSETWKTNDNPTQFKQINENGIKKRHTKKKTYWLWANCTTQRDGEGCIKVLTLRRLLDPSCVVLWFMFAQRANEAEPERSRLFHLIITLFSHRKVRNMQRPERQHATKVIRWLVSTGNLACKQKTNKQPWTFEESACRNRLQVRSSSAGAESGFTAGAIFHN